MIKLSFNNEIAVLHDDSRINQVPTISVHALARRLFSNFIQEEKSIPSLLPPALRWVSSDGKVFAFERPPTQITIQHRAGKVHQGMERAQTTQHTISLPWQMYIYNTRTKILSLSFAKSSMSSMDDIIYAAPISNVSYGNGAICLGSGPQTLEIKRSDPIGHQINTALSAFWSSEFNDDIPILYYSIPTEMQVHPDIQAAVKAHNHESMRALAQRDGLKELPEDFDLQDLSRQDQLLLEVPGAIVYQYFSIITPEEAANLHWKPLLKPNLSAFTLGQRIEIEECNKPEKSEFFVATKSFGEFIHDIFCVAYTNPNFTGHNHNIPDITTPVFLEPDITDDDDEYGDEEEPIVPSPWIHAQEALQVISHDHSPEAILLSRIVPAAPTLLTWDTTIYPYHEAVNNGNFAITTGATDAIHWVNNVGEVEIAVTPQQPAYVHDTYAGLPAVNLVEAVELLQETYGAAEAGVDIPPDDGATWGDLVTEGVGITDEYLQTFVDEYLTGNTEDQED